MDLLRHWRRRTFGAAAGALIVPLAVVGAALAVGLGGGGVGGLRSIGQAFSGPDLPRLSPRAGDGPADSAGRLLARVERAERRRAAGSAGRGGESQVAPSGARGGGSPVAATPTPTPVGRPRPGGGTRPVPTLPTLPPGTRPQPPAATAVPTAPPAAPPPPAPTPTVLRQVGDGVRSITDQVPVAGKPVGDVVDLVVNTVDGLNPRATP